MDRKLHDYFTAGVRLVWYIDIRTYKTQVYTDPEQRVEVADEEPLEGGEVLPGLTLTLRDVFAQLRQRLGP
jgi:Uma2 family endonuclease